MSKKKITSPSQPVASAARPFALARYFPKPAGGTDGDENPVQAELAQLARADRFAARMVIDGALLNKDAVDDPCEIRLEDAVDKLTPQRDGYTREQWPVILAVGVTTVMMERERWAYRVGLAAGLRLARALDGEGGAR